MTAVFRAMICLWCKRPIRTTNDPGVPYVHEDTDNCYCDVTGTLSAVLLAGEPWRTEAEPDDPEEDEPDDEPTTQERHNTMTDIRARVAELITTYEAKSQTREDEREPYRDAQGDVADLHGYDALRTDQAYDAEEDLAQLLTDLASLLTDTEGDHP